MAFGDMDEGQRGWWAGAVTAGPVGFGLGLIVMGLIWMAWTFFRGR